MDRLKRLVAGVGLSISVAACVSGCKTPRSEIPPGKRFLGSGQPQAPLNFGSQPGGPGGFSGLSGAPVDGGPGQNGPGQFGTPPPASSTFGVPNTAAFGAPGTSGLASPPASSLGAPGIGAPGMSNPATGLPQTGTGPTGPAAGAGFSPTAPSGASAPLCGPSPQPFE